MKLIFPTQVDTNNFLHIHNATLFSPQMTTTKYHFVIL